MKSFMEYAGFGKKTKKPRFINEAKLQDLIAGGGGEVKIDPNKSFSEQQDAVLRSAMAGADPRTALEIMRFSRGWTEDLDLCSVRHELNPNNVELFKIAANNNNVKIEVIDPGGEKYELNAKLPMKAQGFFMAALKPLFPGLKVKFANGFVTGTFKDRREALNAYLATVKILGGWNPKKDGKFQPIDDEAQLPPEAAAGYGDAVKANAGGDAVLECRGKLADLTKLFGGPDAFPDGLKLEANATSTTYDMAWLVREFGKDPAALEKLRRMKFGLIFRSFLGTLEQTLADENKNKDEQGNPVPLKDGAFLAELYKMNFNDLLKKYKKEVEELGLKEEKIVPKTPPAIRRMKLFEDAAWYGAQIIDDVNGWIAAVCREHNQAHCFGRYKPKVKRGTNEIDPDTNLRDDELEAKYPGQAEKINGIKKRRDDGGISYVKDGLGFDGCNREMMQCVSGNGNGWTGEWASDGGKGNWRNVSTYFNCKNPKQRMPFIVYMDIKSGRLFCSNCQYETGRYYLASNDGWRQYDFNTERNGENDGGIEHFLSTNAGFRKIYQEANAAAFAEYTAQNAPGAKVKHWEAIEGAPPADKIIWVKYVGKNGPQDLETTDNGIVLIKSRNDFNMMKDQLSKAYITSVKIAFQNADNLFNHMKIGNLRLIDCSDVTSAQSMFLGADFGLENSAQKVDLVSTAKCRIMSEMFRGATNIGQILGLDTSSAETISNMFAGAETFNQLRLFLPALNLQKCRNMDSAFRDSSIAELDLRNFERVSSAIDVICGCWRLEKCSKLHFTIKNPVIFGIDRDKEPSPEKAIFEKVFKGCDQLQQRNDFNETINDLVDYYFIKPSTLQTTDDGAAIVQGYDDACIYCRRPETYKYRVKLANPDMEGCFKGLSPAIAELDMQGVTRADNMFQDCKIIRLGRIINTENLVSASEMFRHSDIKQTPVVDFTHLKHGIGIFCECYELRSCGREKDQNTKFGSFAVPLNEIRNPNFDPLKYVFSTDCVRGGLPETVIKRLGEDRARMMFKPYFENSEIEGVKAWFKEHLIKDDTIKIGSSPEMLMYFGLIKSHPDIAPKTVTTLLIDIDDCTNMFQARNDLDFYGLTLEFNKEKTVCAMGMFQSASIKNLKQIVGMEAVKNANYMFTQAKIEGDLVLKGQIKASAQNMFNQAEINGSLEMDASGISDGIEMFFGAKLNKPLATRDFGSMTSCHRIFSNCVGMGKLKFQDFNFKSVRIADGAFVGQEIVDDSIDVTAVMPAVQSCKSIFSEAKFNQFLDSVKIKCLACKKAFEKTSGVESIGSLDIAETQAASAMFEKSSINIIGRLDVAKAADMREMFIESKLESIMDVNEGFAEANTMNIFSKTPAVAMYGEDGEYLKLYLKGLKEG